MSNEIEDIKKWVDTAIDNCTLELSNFDKNNLRSIGYNEAECGYLRGDISDTFRRINPNLNTGNMPDLVV